MRELPTHNAALPNAPRLGNRLIWQLIIFIMVYLLLASLYSQAADTQLQRLFLETLGSQPAAALLGVLNPNIGIHAEGARIMATGGGLNIRNGCEGVDLFILLTAAFAASALGWRQRMMGWTLGLLLVFCANQLRICLLFYAYRNNLALFDLLHTLAAPIALILFVALYFQVWLNYCRAQEKQA